MACLAQSEPGIPAKLEDFDSDPLLINCRNGAVDLASGDLHPQSRDDRITRIVDIEYDSNARCPKWLHFLSEVMGGDAEMICFLQRAVGYTLTGLTVEQCLFFLYGIGANGKSVFLEILKSLTGGYGVVASTQSLMVSQQQSIPDDIARLAGCRFVAMGETRMASGCGSR
jgi:putative DNA primase/helicase